MQIDESRNGDEVELPLGDVLDLWLPENPTSGFRWKLVSSGDPIAELIGDAFDAPTGPHGGGGIRRMQFRAFQAGSAVVELIYQRGRETDKTTKTFTLHLRVPAPG